jgi:hypothetical protein
MTDMGSLHYFLGIAVTRNSSGMHLSQAKYAAEILDNADMTPASPPRHRSTRRPSSPPPPALPWSTRLSTESRRGSLVPHLHAS